MTEQRKLCKDCLHYEKSWLGHLFRNNSLDKCYNPIITGDLVTGDKKVSIVKLPEILKCIVVEMVSILSNYGVIRND